MISHKWVYTFPHGRFMALDLHGLPTLVERTVGNQQSPPAKEWIRGSSVPVFGRVPCGKPDDNKQHLNYPNLAFVGQYGTMYSAHGLKKHQKGCSFDIFRLHWDSGVLKCSTSHDYPPLA